MGELNSVEALWAARQELPKAGNGQKVALWRVISGLEVGKESELSPGERAAGLRKLVNVFARVLRVEFLEWREKEKGRRGVAIAVPAENGGSLRDLGQAGTPAVHFASEGGSTANGDGVATESGEGFVQADSLHGVDELPRSVVWDPVATVCSYLNVAERMLSRLGREVCGYSAQQMADRLRVKDLRPKLRAELEEFVRKEGAMDHRTLEESSGWRLDTQWYLYKKWVAYKRERMTESNDARAVRFGFKYFGRYKQACLMEFGKTPDELEFEALEDAAMYFAARDTLERRASAVEDPIRSSFRQLATKPYRDGWAKLYRERPEWLMAMKEKFGLDPNLEKHVRETGD